MILSGCHGNSNPKHDHPLNNCPLPPTPIHNIDYTLIHPFSPLISSTNDSGKNKQLLTMEAEKLEFELPPGQPTHTTGAIVFMWSTTVVRTRQLAPLGRWAANICMNVSFQPWISQLGLQSFLRGWRWWWSFIALELCRDGFNGNSNENGASTRQWLSWCTGG